MRYFHIIFDKNQKNFESKFCNFHTVEILRGAKALHKTLNHCIIHKRDFNGKCQLGKRALRKQKFASN